MHLPLGAALLCAAARSSSLCQLAPMWQATASKAVQSMVGNRVEWFGADTLKVYGKISNCSMFWGMIAHVCCKVEQCSTIRRDCCMSNPKNCQSKSRILLCMGT